MSDYALLRHDVPALCQIEQPRQEGAQGQAVVETGTGLSRRRFFQVDAIGGGIVLDSRIQDDDEIVDVVFESVGIKRLAASLANLTIIK